MAVSSLLQKPRRISSSHLPECGKQRVSRVGETKVTDHSEFVRIDGPNGTFWIATAGLDPDHNRVFAYKDEARQFYFSHKATWKKIGGQPDHIVTHADRERRYGGAIVVLGKDVANVTENIKYLLTTRSFQFPDQHLADPRDIPHSILFRWEVR